MSAAPGRLGLWSGLLSVLMAVSGCGSSSPAVPAVRDPRHDLCPVGAGNVAASFPLERARDFWVAVPRAARAPELENDKPAYIVVFAGPVLLPHFGSRPRDARGNRLPPDPNAGTYTGVVCVVIDGDPIVYVDIELEGARQPY